MKYSEKLTGGPHTDFELFVGARPAPGTDLQVVADTAKFFIVTFGSEEYDPDSEDPVVQFCQMVPAGAYGSLAHSYAYRQAFPDYTDAMDEAICAAWQAVEVQKQREQIVKRLEADYGEPGMCALETACVVNADYARGYDHVVSLILPALEEELGAE